MTSSRSLAAILLVASAAACASGGAGAIVDEVVLDAPAEGADLLDAALVASGYESKAALRSARATLERLVGPIIEELKKVPDEAERGRLLLNALHAKGGLLGEYDTRATTLHEMLGSRQYNCVSASVMYNVLAERLKLDVAAQLLPTHARTLLSARAKDRLRRIVIETTSPHGFDPSTQAQAEILATVGGPRAKGARAIVSESGEIVNTRVLIGVIYINRASIAQEAGALERAERLFALGESFADGADLRRVLRDQRAALLSQLAADDILSEDQSRFPRAYRTLKAAIALDPKHPKIRASVLQNLRAAAERVIHEEAQKGDEKALLALAGEAASFGLESADRSGLRAFALSEVSRLRIDASDFEGAVDAIDLALKEQLAAPDDPLKQTLKQNRVAALRLAAITQAKHGNYKSSLELLERLEALMDLTEDQRAETTNDRLRVIHLVGNKRIDDLDFVGAAQVYREGVRRFPRDEASRHNLVAVLERLALPLVDETRCSEVRELLDEIRMVEPGSDFPGRAEVRCLLERARRRLADEDYEEAVSLIRAARRASPSEPVVTQNLGVALLSWARVHAKGGRCAEVARLVKEIRSLALPDIPGSELERVLGSCRG